MTPQEEYELRLMGFSKEQIEEMRKAQKSAQADINGKSEKKDAKKGRKDS